MTDRTTRPRRIAVWTVAAAVLTAAGLTGAVWLAAVEHRSILGALVGDLPAIGFVLVGALIAAARPRNRVGWWMLAGGVCWALGDAAAALARHGLVVAPGSVPGAAAWAIAGQGVRSTGWNAIALVVPVYFPDGRVAGPRWRWLERALAVVLVAAVIDPATDPKADYSDLGHWHNRLAPSGAWQVLNLPVFAAHIVLGLVVAVAAVVQLVHRWRSGDARLRQQLLLFALAVAVSIVAVPVALITQSGTVFVVSALALSTAVGFAVLARGLYDLRTATNRTLVWFTLSITVAALFALVIGLGTLVHSGPTAPWLPWLAAGIAAVCLTPLRDALQRGVNRVTFGRWNEPYELLATLGQRLEAATGVDRLLADVVAELQSLGLRDVRIVARSEPSEPPPAPDEVVVPLSAYGSLVGALRYRSPEAPLRSRDIQLVDDLAAHLGAVLHARSLTQDLQRARERLVLGREEERRRLRRDLHDGLGPALAGHLLRLDVIAARIGPDGDAAALVDALRADLRETVIEVRRVVEGLRPPALDELGLAAALTQASSRLVGGSVIDARVHAAQLPTLPAAVEVAAYRIAVEGLTNAVRHSAATRCIVDLGTEPGHLVIAILDNGRGFSVDAVSFGHGLHTMRERAEELRGSLEISSGEDGSRVVARLPVTDLTAGHAAEPAVAP